MEDVKLRYVGRNALKQAFENETRLIKGTAESGITHVLVND